MISFKALAAAVLLSATAATPAFRAINPNGKVPAIVDTQGPGGKEVRVFDSSAILLYLGEKTGRLIGSPSRVSGQATWRSIVPIDVP